MVAALLTQRGTDGDVTCRRPETHQGGGIAVPGLATADPQRAPRRAIARPPTMCWWTATEEAIRTRSFYRRHRTRRWPASACRWRMRCAPSAQFAGCISSRYRMTSLPLLELSLKAPTSSDTQDWHYVVVEDAAQKARLAKLYRRLYRVINPIIERRARATSESDAPSHPANGRPRTSSTGRFSPSPAIEEDSNTGQSDTPRFRWRPFTVRFSRCSESAAGVPGRGPRRIASDAADLVGSRGAAHPQVAPQHSSGLHHPHRLGQGTLRPHYPETYR